MTMKPQIPVIDLTDARSSDRTARLRLGQLIDRTCTEIGFFTITGHGVPADAIRGLNRKAHEFFALPMEEKQAAMPADITIPRGYKPVGYEALGYGNANMTPPDLKEYYHLGRESWPDEPYFTSAEGQRYFIQNIWPRIRRVSRKPQRATTPRWKASSASLMRVVALGPRHRRALLRRQDRQAHHGHAAQLLSRGEGAAQARPAARRRAYRLWPAHHPQRRERAGRIAGQDARRRSGSTWRPTPPISSSTSATC